MRSDPAATPPAAPAVGVSRSCRSSGMSRGAESGWIAHRQPFHQSQCGGRWPDRARSESSWLPAGGRRRLGVVDLGDGGVIDRHSAGNSMTKRAPCWPSLRSSTRPSCRRMCSSTRASTTQPSLPERCPALMLRENRSKIRARSSTGTPGPWSSTAILTCVSTSASALPSSMLTSVGRRRRRCVVDEVGDHPRQATAIAADDRALRPRRRHAPRRPAPTRRRRRCARTDWRTESSRWSRIAPASKRLISSRSSTSPRKRATSLTRRSSAACARSASRRAAPPPRRSRPTASSEGRSSCETSEAKRASRSTRCCSAAAMSLNGAGEHPEIGISGSRPCLQPAAGDRLGGFGGVGNGRTARRAASTPTSTPSPVVIVAARAAKRHVGERLVVVAEVEELEVVGVDALQADPDDLVGDAVDLGDHPRVDVVPSPTIAQCQRDRLLAQPAARRRPFVVPEERRTARLPRSRAPR